MVEITKNDILYKYHYKSKFAVDMNEKLTNLKMSEYILVELKLPEGLRKNTNKNNLLR